MNVAFFADCWEPQINGVVVSMKNLERALTERGHRVFPYAPAVRGAQASTPAVFRQRAVVYPFQREFNLAVPFYRRALRRARRQSIDLVHGHTEFSLGAMAGAVSRRLAVPFVFTLHTLWKYYAHYLFWGLLPDNLTVPVMRRFYRRVDYFIAPSSKIKSYLEKEFRMEANITTIPTGLDLDIFYGCRPTAEATAAFRARYGLLPSDTVMLFTGRLGREKSIDVLIDGLPALLKERPRLKLLLVGDGPTRSELAERARALGVERALAFTGYLTRDVLPLAYQAADFFVIASTTETQGLVTVEAMASGLPVIAREDAAQLDILGRRENGLIWSDVSGFVRAALSLTASPGLKADLRAKSLERSRAFTLREFGERMENHYHWVIEDFKRCGGKHRRRRKISISTAAD